MNRIDDMLAAAVQLHQAGRLPDAATLYQQILAADANHVDALQLLGAIAHQQGQHGAAVELIQRSLAIAPDNKQALNNLGEALRATGQIDQSVAAFRRAIALDSSYVKAHSNLLLTLHFDPASTGESLRREHELWGKQHAPAVSSPPKREHAGPLRIGYVSPDFKRHSVAYFIEPVIRHHHRDRVHVTCYSNAAREDEITHRIRAVSDEWRDIARLNDDDAANLVRQDRIDILIDLTGHMARNRLLLFARRPAPIQVTYLGYPNGTGVPQIDYRITDAVADPPNATDAHYVEKLVRLPACAWCYQPPTDAPMPTATTNRPITFGSFNKFPKISPATMKMWSRILAAAPESRLLLKAKSLGDPTTRAIASQMLASAGIAPDCVHLTGWAGETSEHLAMYKEIDVALDSFPYHGTTTTCEAIWMGVPVVTLAGDKHVSRVGASLLTAVGHPEWIAATPDQYVAIASHLAKDPDARRSAHRELRHQMLESPLMQPKAFVQSLEDAYENM